jgi:hypothetical protein
MFKVISEPTFTIPVTVCVPVDGGHKDQDLKVKFRVVDVDELGEAGGLEGQQKLLKRVVCGFEEVVDDNDQPLSYSDELRDQLIAVPYVRAAMLQTYLAAIAKTRVGN